ncbi:hypothetical protein Tco_0549583, partial [Tanacetum coccineum]
MIRAARRGIIGAPIYGELKENQNKSEILQEKENERQYWASCNPNRNIYGGGDLQINVEKRHWKSNNDSKREELEWENLSLNDWMRIRYGKVCKMIKERILKDYCEDEDDLEGILDYLKPRSYDGFIDLDDEAYNKRRCILLGMTYEEPTPIIIEKDKVTRCIVGPGETYTK